MPVAYSYLRFSSPEQLKGDSFRRQTEAARKFAAENGLKLDETLSFRDLGVSAFRGQNAHDGLLGEFLRAVDDGRVSPGSWLLVENLDRLSRMPVMDAFDLFRSILNRGVTVVTLMDRQVYTKSAMNFTSLLLSLAQMHRAHEESQAKAHRIGAAWERKREDARETGKVLTRIAPAWLEVSADGSIEVIPERAEVVARIFSLALSGLGKVAIARRLNADRVPTFGRSDHWHTSYIQKILANRAVIGEFQPMRLTVSDTGTKRRVPDGDPLADYFPAVMSKADFFRFQDQRQSGGVKSGRTGETFSNLFRGLARCGACGAPMVYANKGEGRGTFLVCRTAQQGAGCNYRSWRYASTERYLLQGMRDMDFAEVFPNISSAAQEAVRALEGKQAVAADALAKAQERAANIADAVAEGGHSPTLLKRLAALEEEQATLEASAKALDEQLAAARATAAQAARGRQEARARLLAVLRGESDDLYLERSRLHQFLGKTIAAFTFYPGGARKDTHGRVAITLQGVEDTGYEVQIGGDQLSASIDKMVRTEDGWEGFPLASYSASR